jgi:hypothetical protein
MTANSSAPSRRSPGRERWQLRVTLFVLFFGAFCAGAAAFIKYYVAEITATAVPTSTHTVKLIQTGRTLYFSEQQWNQVLLLGLCSGSLGILGLLVMVISLRLDLLLRSVFQAFDTKAPIWDASEPPRPPVEGLSLVRSGKVQPRDSCDVSCGTMALDTLDHGVIS